MSRRFYTDLTSIARKCHIDFTSTSRRSLFDLISVSLRFHSECNSIQLLLHIDATSKGIGLDLLGIRMPLRARRFGLDLLRRTYPIWGGTIVCLAKASVLPDVSIWRIFLRIALALEYLHSKRILHRDVKVTSLLSTRFHFWQQSLVGQKGFLSIGGAV